MTHIALTVNGEGVKADVVPRTHLADFLRDDLLLTGTHIGCEHGVCGACTLLVDGAPARSCIAFAVACDGTDVRTIEGLEDDPVVVRLRAAFTAEHALQCGYCTPGMLVTAFDIVRRLPRADDERIRLELAGNLCRCTGYAGIVRAIRRVLTEGVPAPPVAAEPLPSLPLQQTSSPEVIAPAPGGVEFTRTLRLELPVATVWSALRDPKVVAECIPGAKLVDVTADRLRGEVRAALGPIETLFAGEGVVHFDDVKRHVALSGAGRDSRSGTRVNARATVHVDEIGAATTGITMTIDYALRGPLAQFARGSIAQEFAAEVMATFAANLEAKLMGTALPRQPRLLWGSLMLRVVWGRVRALLGFR